MGLALAKALRLDPVGGAASPAPCRIAFVGAGGKTTALFQLARQLGGPVVVTTTTHLGAWQAALADSHLVVETPADLPEAPPADVTLVTGRMTAGPQGEEQGRFGPAPDQVLVWLHDKNPWRQLPLLVEADGAHRKPLKAPVAHEPAIPPYMGILVVVAGLSGLGRPLSEESVHRAQQFAALSGLKLGDEVTPEGLTRVLTDPQGGCKGIPLSARRVVLLNQADTSTLQSEAARMAPALLKAFDAVLIASLHAEVVHAVHEPVAGILLAAGASRRLGRPKALLDWRGAPFVRVVAETALRAGLSPVVVVTGSDAQPVEAALSGLPISVVHNAEWESGQSSSIAAGLRGVPDRTGAAVFLLADQPQVGVEVISALANRHAASLASIIAPLVMDEHRANPVLFDRVTFPDLFALNGDVGGRAVFDRHRVDYVPWYDARLLLDVDTEDDYRRLLEEGQQ